MKNIFSKGLYLEGLRRIKIFSIIIAALTFLFTISPFILNFSTIFSTSANGITAATVISYQEICSLLPTIGIIIPFIMTLIVFAQFNSRKYCDFYHSLPYKRSTIYFSFIAAIVTVIVALAIMSIGLKVLLYSIFTRLYIVTFQGLFSEILTFIAATLFIIAATVLGCSLTGATFSSIMTSFAVITLPRFIMGICFYTLASNCSIISLHPVSNFFSPSMNACVYGLLKLYNQTEFSYLPALYTLLVSIILFALSFYFFVTRKSENASKPAANKLVHSGVRISVGLALSVIGTLVLVISTEESRQISIPVAIILYIASFILYCSYELITTKKWKNVLRSLPGIAVVVAINLICGMSISLGATVAENYLPEAEDVEYIQVTDNSAFDGMFSYLLFDSYDNQYFKNEAQNIKITDNNIKKHVLNILKENVKNEADNKILAEYINYTSLCFKIKQNGIIRYRTISFTEADYKTYIELLKGCDNYVKKYMNIPKSIESTFIVTYSHTSMSKYSNYSLTDIEINNIIEFYQSEISEKEFDEYVDFIEGLSYEKYYGTNSLCCDFYISYNKADGMHQTVTITINDNFTPKTYNYLLEILYNKTKDDALKCFEEIASGVKTVETLSISFYDNEKSGYLEYILYNDTLDTYKDDASKEIYTLITSNTNLSPQIQKLMFINIGIYLGQEWNNYVDYYTYVLPIPEDYDLSNLNNICIEYENSNYYTDIVDVEY